MVEFRDAFLEDAVELDRCADIVSQFVSNCFIVVALCSTTSLKYILKDTASAKRYYVFPVLLHKGYHQKAEDSTGGTGMFVVVVCHMSKVGTLKFRNTESENLIPSIGFSFEHQCFYSNKATPINRVTQANDPIPASEPLLPEFMVSLGQFIEATAKSCMVVVGSSTNNTIAFASQLWLRNRRRCVYINQLHGTPEEMSNASMIKLCGRIVLLATNNDKKLVLDEKKYTSIFSLLPPASSAKAKIITFKWLQQFIDSAVSETTVFHWIDSKLLPTLLEKDAYNELYQWDRNLAKSYHVTEIAEGVREQNFSVSPSSIYSIVSLSSLARDVI